MRNDPEFSFYGKKFDDSKAGNLEDDDTTPAMASTNGNASTPKNENDMDITTDEQVSTNYRLERKQKRYILILFFLNVGIFLAIKSRYWNALTTNHCSLFT
jgi:hypothetical protein